MRRAGMVQRSRGFSRGGKCGGRAGKQRVLTWGDPKEEMPWEVSRGHSSVEGRETGWSEGLNRSAGIRPRKGHRSR